VQLELLYLGNAKVWVWVWEETVLCVCKGKGKGTGKQTKVQAKVQAKTKTKAKAKPTPKPTPTPLRFPGKEVQAARVRLTHFLRGVCLVYLETKTSLTTVFLQDNESKQQPKVENFKHNIHKPTQINETNPHVQACGSATNQAIISLRY